MKILLSLILYFQLTLGNEIEFFSGSWNEVTSKASAENKIIFVDVYADWCAPCKWMAKNVFTNDSAAEYYNTTFINWSIDAEKGEGPGFAKNYQVRYYSTFLFIDASGNIIHKVIGSMPVQDFIEAGKNAANPETSLSGMKVKYESGVRDKEFLRNYILTLNNSYMISDDVVNEYFKQLGQEEIVTKENYEILSKMGSPNNDLFRYLAANTSKFKQFDDLNTSSDALVAYVYINYIQSNAKKMNEEELYKMTTDVRGYNNPELHGLTAIMKTEYYKANKKWDKFAENVDGYIKDEFKSEENAVAALRLNDYAWTMHENSNDSKLLKKALGWAKLSVKKDETFYNLDTYAALLYKTGNKEKALKYYKKAVASAEKYQEDAASQKKMIKKIEKELDE